MNSEAGTLLVEGSLITEAQLRQALATAIQHGGTLVQSLIRLGHVSGSQLASYLASRLRLPMAEHSQFDNLPAFITRLIPNDIVISHRLVPIMLHKGVLHVAMSDPTDRAALEEIGFSTGYTASPVVAPYELVEEAMARYYGIPPDEAKITPAEIPLPEEPAEPVQFPQPAPQTDSQPPTAFAAPAPMAPEPPPQPPPEPEPEPEPPAAGPEAGGESVGLEQARRSLEVVETENGEMEELFFGLGRSDKPVVHLTKRKTADPVPRTGTIADAIRAQTVQDDEPPAGQPPAPEVSAPQPAAEAPKPAEPPKSEPVKNIEPEKSEESTAEYLEGLLEGRKSVFASPVGRTARQAPKPAPAEPEPAPAQSEVQLPDIEVEAPEYETETEPLRDFDEVKSLLAKASDRDEVAQILIRFALDFFPRLALFIVKKDTMVGWMGAGGEITNRQVKGIMIPMGSPSVFRTVKETATDYFGSLPRTTVNDVFISAMGTPRPRQVLVVPINVRNKPVSIFYGDCGTSMGFMKDLSPVYRIIQEASRSFEKIILSAKMGRKVVR